MEKSEKIRLILTTTDDWSVARKIAGALIEKKLAACCSIIENAQSIYEWNGKLEETGEYMMFIKTTDDAVEEAEREINRVHNYEVPETLVLATEAASSPYLRWVLDSVKPKKRL